jgi:nitrogen fixation protein FixH
MKLFRLVSEYRWPIYIGGHLTMSIVACGILVWVATRPDAPRPIEGYYEAAQAWDADERVLDASRGLGWTVTFDLPSGVPHVPGMPRPVDVTVVDRSGNPVAGLAGQLLASRPSDTRLNQRGELLGIPSTPGRYRTLVRLDEPGSWEFRIDTHQATTRFVHAARVSVPGDAPGTMLEAASR